MNRSIRWLLAGLALSTIAAPSLSQSDDGIVSGDGYMSAAGNLRLYMARMGRSGASPEIVRCRSVGPLELTAAVAGDSRYFFIGVTINNPTDKTICFKPKGFIVAKANGGTLQFADTWSLYTKYTNGFLYLTPHKWMSVKLGMVDIMGSYLPEGGPRTSMHPTLDESSRWAVWTANPPGSPRRCSPVTLDGYDNWLQSPKGDLIQASLLG